jgi:hypothetical protein
MGKLVPGMLGLLENVPVVLGVLAGLLACCPLRDL